MRGIRCSFLLPLIPPLLMACGELATEGPTSPPGPDFKPGAGGPGYALVQAQLPVGYTASRGVAVNRAHMVAGWASGAPGRGHRALAWELGAGTAATTLLPEPPGAWQSEAHSINDLGTVGGEVDGAAVLWVPDGAGWRIEQLHGQGVVRSVRNDGAAVGSIFLDEAGFEHQPAFWNAAGALTPLPLPASAQWPWGVGFAINAQGDVAGALYQPVPGGGTLEYGAVWLYEGTGWTVLAAETGPALGIADRAADGSVRVATVTGELLTYAREPITERWTATTTMLPGAGLAVSPAGDIAGFISKGGWVLSLGTPYLLSQAGVLTKLPLPKGKTGAARGVSGDLWLAGEVDGRASAWILVP